MNIVIENLIVEEKLKALNAVIAAKLSSDSIDELYGRLKVLMECTDYFVDCKVGKGHSHIWVHCTTTDKRILLITE